MERSHGARPVVLVHGSYHGAWCWQQVHGHLSGAGLQVHTPVCPGLGERRAELALNPSLDDWTIDLVAYLEAHDLRDVVLVGHSLAGGPISGVADRAPERLHHLVYLDASVPEDGFRFSAAVGEAAWRQRLQRCVVIDGVACLPPPEPEYFGVGDPAAADWLRRHLTPMPVRLFDSALRLAGPAGNGVPASFVHCVSPRFLHIERYAERARAAGWPVHELLTGHDAMVTEPAALAALIAPLAKEN